MNSQLPLPDNEIARLNTLRQYQILDTHREKAFDDFTFLAAQTCTTPIALIGLMDGSRLWFKSKVGLTITETSRDVAFCAHTILQPSLLVVNDTLTDRRFSTNPLVISDPNVRFYAGAPLVTSEGFAIGTLCVIDIVPRELSIGQAEALRALSRQVMAQLELRRNVVNLSRTISEREQAIEKHRRQHHYIDVFYHTGVDKARSGDYSGAIEDFNQFLRLNPKGVKAYYNRGLARRRLGDCLGAKADFNKFLQLYPKHAGAYLNRGLVRSELGDYLGALADYNQARSINPNINVLEDERGLAGAELGDDYTHSLSQLKDANTDINWDRASPNLREQPGSIDVYAKSLPQNLNSANANVSRGDTKSNSGQLGGAIVNHTNFRRYEPKDTNFDISQGNARYELKDYRGAIADYTQALRLNPNDAQTYVMRGHALSKLKDYQGAIEDYTQALRLNPNDAKAYVNRGNARSKLKDYQGAIEDYTQGVGCMNQYAARNN